MPRYIEADDAIYELKRAFSADDFGKIIRCISRTPTADVVEVVRCKDCRHNSLNRVSGNAFCNLGIGLNQIYDFCSRGERREDDEERS